MEVSLGESSGSLVLLSKRQINFDGLLIGKSDRFPWYVSTSSIWKENVLYQSRSGTFVKIMSVFLD